MRIRFRADARRELLAACDYIDKERPGYGDLFSERVQREIELICEFPKIGKLLVDNARRRMIRGWSYSIVYLDRGHEIVVVAIAHYRRDPNYWLPRIR